MEEKIGLRQILDYQELDKLFTHFSVTTGFDVALYDTKGEEQFSRRSGQSICGNVPVRNECVRNLVYAGGKAHQLGEPYIYACGCGLILCSVPIQFNGVLLGSIVCGPVMLWDADELADREISDKSRTMFQGRKIELSQITQTSCAKLTSAVSILFVLVNYICNQAEKHLEQKLEISRQQERILKLSLERQQALDSIKMLERYSYVKYPAETERELIAFVQRGDKQKAREILNHFLGEIFSFASGDLNMIKAKLYEFIAFLTRATVESGVPLEEMMGSIKKSTKLLEENIEFQDLCLIVVEILNQIIDRVYENRGKKTASPHLTNAINFINQNYAGDLTLVEVAKNAFVNSYYLSHLFRDEMKITFSEYLTKVRIERAKELFRERDLGIDEVSEAVGFHDPSHFSRAFKKQVGVTPAKYKKIWF